MSTEIQTETVEEPTSSRMPYSSSEDVAASRETMISSLSIENLVARKRYKTVENDKSLSNKTRAYYKKQDEFIDSLVEFSGLNQRNAASSATTQNDAVVRGVTGAENASEASTEDSRVSESLRVQRFAKILLGLNVILVAGKLVAAILSGSLAIVSVLVDNVIDMLSGLVIWLTNRAMMKRRPYAYPEGRRRLEPIAIIILAVVMSVASLQVVIAAVERIISLAQSDNPEGPNMSWITLGIVGADIVVKVCVIFAFLRTRHNPSVAAMIQDARNDVISNVLSIVCGLIAYYFWAFTDPIGSICISTYIIVGWMITLVKKVRTLIGLSADPEFIRQVTWLAVNHDERIKEVDTVRAFHVGSDLFVEVDIVLSGEMRLQEAHDVGETLQRKIEALPNVERAFVHLDHESDHNPSLEHKQN